MSSSTTATDSFEDILKSLGINEYESAVPLALDEYATSNKCFNSSSIHYF